MSNEDRLRRYQDAGAEFLGAARAKAEEIFRDVSGAGEAKDKQASSEGPRTEGRRSTDQLLEAVRREVTAQLSSLGLATKGDLAALERRLTGRAAPAKKAAGSKKAAAPAKKAAASKKAAGSKKAAAKKAPAKKAPAKKAPGRSAR